MGEAGGARRRRPHRQPAPVQVGCRSAACRGAADAAATTSPSIQARRAAIERVDGILARSRFLFGETLTEADINLWTSLYRWWTVYEVHFKLNRHNLLHYRNVARFVKELYQLDAFRNTTNTAHIKWHYYNTQRPVNPYGIVPDGPSLDWLEE